MGTKNATATLIIVLILIFYAALRWIVLEPHRKEPFDRHPSHITYSSYAACRMDCHHLGEKDIEEVMRHGIILISKSNPNARPCATYAIQGYSKSHQNIRLIFAQCHDETSLVTCYVLNREVECNCK